MKYTIVRSLSVVVLLFASLGILPLQSAYAAQVCYVKAGSSGAHNGSSWVNAYNGLQGALANAACTEIWVAAGTYYPTNGTSRTATFTLKNGVAIYGGFVGTETLRSQRNWTTHQTNLSGDIGVALISGDNSYHVVTGTNTNASAVLNGFFILRGNANGAAYPNNSGGGMFNSTGNPTLTNVTFGLNGAAYGAGMYNYASNPKLTHVSFGLNYASISGAGMNNQVESSPDLTDVTFNTNQAAGPGGGMYVAFSCNPQLTNVTFESNQASDGGGMYITNASSATLSNVIFDANTATHNGGGLAVEGSAAVLADVTFSDNTAANAGGGIYGSTDPYLLTNVTFSGNSAISGGGIYNDHSSDSTTASITNLTFAAYTASVSGGAMYNTDASFDVVMKDVILWGDNAPQGPEAWNASAAPVIKDSVVQGGCPGGSVCTHIITADPLLAALGANGGYAATIALGMGSSAIDAGGAHAACAATDERGIHRPQGLACDIGAFEVSNLVLNPGFNTYTGTSNIPAKWFAASFAASDGKDTTTLKEGTASVKISGAAAGTKTLSQSITTGGPTGTKFVFTYWARGASIPTAGLCRGQVLVYSGSTLDLTEPLPCANGSYATFQKKTISFSTTSSFTSVVIQFTYSKASGTVWFDAVSLMR